jgi:hypothetical protein
LLNRHNAKKGSELASNNNLRKSRLKKVNKECKSLHPFLHPRPKISKPENKYEKRPSPSQSGY